MSVGPVFTNIKDWMAAEAEFSLAYGRALSSWASLEQVLYTWFHEISGMPPAMSRGIFYSARNFNGRSDMLEAAISTSTLPTEFIEFIKAAIKKSVQFNAFRNSIAHGEPALYKPNQNNFEVRQIMIQGSKGTDTPPDLYIDVTRLDVARFNFGALRSAMIDALLQKLGVDDPGGPTLQECLERVRALPNRADLATPAPTKPKRQRPPRSSRA